MHFLSYQVPDLHFNQVFVFILLISSYFVTGQDFEESRRTLKRFIPDEKDAIIEDDCAEPTNHFQSFLRGLSKMIPGGALVDKLLGNNCEEPPVKSEDSKDSPETEAPSNSAGLSDQDEHIDQANEKDHTDHSNGNVQEDNAFNEEPSSQVQTVTEERAPDFPQEEATWSQPEGSANNYEYQNEQWNNMEEKTYQEYQNYEPVNDINSQMYTGTGEL